jgi:Ribonuclease G/E
MGTDMKNLTKEIVHRIFPSLEKKLVLYGNSKIYMKMDVAHKLDRLLQEWWKYKSEKALII